MKEGKYWGESPKKNIKGGRLNGGSKDEKHISVHENKIYYYSGVNRDSASELNKKLGELESKSLTLCHSLDLEVPPAIKIYINSGGGSITSGISSINPYSKQVFASHNRSCFNISSNFFIGTLVCSLYTLFTVSIIKSKFCFSSSNSEYFPQKVVDNW